MPVFVRIVSFVVVLLVAGAHAGESLKTPIDGIMATGRQIAQVRFMLEVYSTIGAGIKYQAPKTKLKQAITSYETTLAQLKAITDPVVQDAVAKSQAAWPPVKKALLTALEKHDTARMKDQALFVHGNIRTVIKEMEIMKDYFLQKLHTPKAQEINAGIEIATSARRLSSHYMLKMWEVPDPTIEAHWKKGMEKYRIALDTLAHSSVNNDPTLAPLLAICKKEYTFFQTLIGLKTYMPVLAQRHAVKAYDAAGKIVMKLLGR